MFTSILTWTLGAPEIILIVVLILILFGGRKLPELMRGMGQGIREFKKASRGDDSSLPENKGEKKAE